ncbi:MAG TPA: DUF488 domain-containing protein [Acidobacteriota bacterium]|jgi:uncharacterized protein (DUF488 family)|nr:DUF488 domain-containing protein [Acidobacteriota bacterium]
MPQANRLKLPTAPLKKQIANRETWNEERSPEDADFFTFGYTGRKTDELLNLLVEHGIRTLLDIRQNAISMYRPDLSKKNLQQAVEALGMAYVHMPELGVPRDIRAKAIESGSREVIWEWYDEYVAQPYLANLHRFLNSVEHPAALMCAELDPIECHRHRLFTALEELGLSGFEL